jgi:hypothetical protein
VHLGGKILQHFKTLKTRTKFAFSLILGFALVTFGCITSENITHFNVTAEGTSDGILLNFNNIPEDTVFLWVKFTDTTSNDNPRLQDYNIYFFDNKYTGENKLTDLKESGYFIWPFVKTGHEYTITAYSRTNIDSKDYSEEYSTNAIAGGGIYLINNPSLHFTNENNSLTLSEMPLFSNGVSYSYPQEGIFFYSVHVFTDYTDEWTGYGTGIQSNELTVNSVFTMIDIIKESYKDVEFKGELSVSAEVSCSLNYGNQSWGIHLAESEEIIVSF